MAKQRQNFRADLCPCDRQLPYADCCGRWHAGEHGADALSIMRARYSAYVLNKPNFVLATWHPSTRPESISLDPRIHWLTLEIVGTDVVDTVTSYVEFIARHKLNGKAGRLHERSRFLLVDGQWLYVDGNFRTTAGSTAKP